MKLPVAVLAMLAVTLSATPVMASVAHSTGSNGGHQAHHRHHHHHTTHRKHHHVSEGANGAAVQDRAAIA
jgi:hypothetical protein